MHGTMLDSTSSPPKSLSRVVNTHLLTDTIRTTVVRGSGSPPVNAFVHPTNSLRPPAASVRSFQNTLENILTIVFANTNI